MQHRSSPFRASTLGAAAGLAALALALPSGAHASPVTVDTLASWDATTSVNAYGTGATHTYGQIVTAPAGATQLREFALQVSLPTALVSRAEVYAWDGTKAVGPALYESAPFSTTTPPTNDDGDPQFELVTFAIPSAPVVAGQQYVMFLSVDRDLATTPPALRGVFGGVPADTYPDGAYVYFNDASADDWTASAWDGGVTDGYASQYDLAFRATFDDGTTVDTTPAAPPTVATTEVAPAPVVPAPAVTPAPTPVADTAPPVLSDLRVTRRQIRFRVSEAASLRVFVSRRVVRQTGPAGARRSVVSYRRVRSFAVAKRLPGVASVRMDDALRDGRYRISVTARDAAGNAAKRLRVYRSF
jgi:hypothetical protein